MNFELPVDPTTIPGQKLVDRQIKINGLKMWKMNVQTRKVEEIIFPKGMVILPEIKDGRPGEIERKVFVEPMCIYCQALNYKNAVRKFNKMFNYIMEKHRYEAAIAKSQPIIIKPETKIIV